MAKVTIGGVEESGDLDNFIKLEAAWPHIARVNACFQERGEPTEQFPEGAPNVRGALAAMIEVAAVATFPHLDTTLEKDLEEAFKLWSYDVRKRVKPAEYVGLRNFFNALTEEAELSGNVEPAPAPAIETPADPQNPSTGASTASSLNSSPPA